jgi:hypothetical protein
VYVAIGFIVLVNLNILDLLSFACHGFWVVIQIACTCNGNLNFSWVAPAKPNFILKVVTTKRSIAFVVSNYFELPM